ncbi:MAG: DUF3786 domain-containing protein [Desulfobacterium sp.]|nr:DUF3786 domain-containing protein [Desulfobacterium sp.]MBU3947606.1 DUF3786 domain-containing protein [Pseudomonadota bacterium]MBU4009661.1 DUF3786 domain-containing protein [Pseudomonadota bacterium]MBU4036957.1 DUF3786 domain-containing protein [Pseudomonadota bacterium]
MLNINNPIEILKLLEKSNCRECGKPTCLAFAGAVFKREKKLEDCPRLDSNIIKQVDTKTDAKKGSTQQQEEAIKELKQRIAAIDLAAAAKRLGAQYESGKLTLQCLGKNFGVDDKGNIVTEIHVNPQVTIPILNYILYGAGASPSGEWVTFRELKGGEEWYPLYSQRAEKPLKKIADTYTELFSDMLQIFNGKRIDYHYPAEISIVLQPLPKVPILICYSGPEDGLESTLTIFYDKTVEENLNIEAIYGLIAGMVAMFGKLSLRHGNG